MSYKPGWDDPGEPMRRPGGVGSVLTTALWASAGLAVIVLMAMGAYSLGARDINDVVAMKDAAWRSAPSGAGGARTEGADSPAFEPLGPAASDPADDLILGGAPERPTAEDAAAAEEAIELGGGDPIPGDALIDLVSAAVDNPEAAQRQRTVELEPVAPRDGEIAEIGPEREDLPPNEGDGSPPPPPSTAAYLPGGGTDSPPDPEAAPLDAPPGAGAPAIEIADAGPPAATPPTEASPTESPPAAAAPIESPPAAAPAVTPPAATAAVTPPAAGQPPAGPAMFQIQLAALDSVAAVEQRWEEIRVNHPDLVGSLELDIQPFNIDTLRLYRLRVGEFSSRQEASDLCKQLSARGVDCFPATR